MIMSTETFDETTKILPVHVTNDKHTRSHMHWVTLIDPPYCFQRIILLAVVLLIGKTHRSNKASVDAHGGGGN